MTMIENDARGAGLSRERLVEAAIIILDEEGLAGLTMRKLAAAVSAKAMSLYRHFPNKEALLLAVSDELFAEIARADRAGGDCLVQLRATMLSAHRVCLRHPSFKIAMFDLPKTPKSAGLGHGFREMLEDAGLSETDSLAAVSTCVAHLIGALYESRGPYHMVNSARERDRAFEWGLDVILDGLRLRLTEAERSKPAANAGPHPSSR